MVSANFGHKTWKYIVVLVAFFVSFSTLGNSGSVRNGIATHRDLGKPVFMAALYSQVPSDDAATLLCAVRHCMMEIRVLAKRWSKRQFQQLWRQNVSVNSARHELKRHGHRLLALNDMIGGDLYRGDVFLIDSREQIHISLNGVSLGTIDDKEFFVLLLRTWVGDVPLSSTFRAALLTAGQIAPAISEQFRLLQPLEDRIQAVNNWRLLASAKSDQDVRPARVSSGERKANASVIQSISITTPVVKVWQAEKQAKPVDVVAPEPAVRKTEVVATAKPVQPVKRAGDSASKSKAQSEKRKSSQKTAAEHATERWTVEGLLVEQAYQSELLKWTYRYLKYPNRAKRREEQGSVRLRIKIDRAGKVLSNQFVDESRYTLLNKAATKAVRRAEPYPTMPDVLQGDEYVFELPIVFSLR